MPSIRTSTTTTTTASTSSNASSSKKPTDPFYGHKELALLSEFVVNRLFSVPTSSSSSSSNCCDSETSSSSKPLSKSGKPVPRLGEFIAYAIYRTRLPAPILFSSLLLLRRLKTLYPSAKGTPTSPHRLFLSSLMLSSKISMDDTYSNRSWTIVANGGGMDWEIKEINQMERELFGFLKFDVVIKSEELEEWQEECKMAWIEEMEFVKIEKEMMMKSKNEEKSQDATMIEEDWVEKSRRHKLASDAAEALLRGSKSQSSTSTCSSSSSRSSRSEDSNSGSSSPIRSQSSRSSMRSKPYPTSSSRRNSNFSSPSHSPVLSSTNSSMAPSPEGPLTPEQRRLDANEGFDRSVVKVRKVISMIETTDSRKVGKYSMPIPQIFENIDVASW